jgi:hypothetical protein
MPLEKAAPIAPRPGSRRLLVGGPACRTSTYDVPPAKEISQSQSATESRSTTYLRQSFAQTISISTGIATYIAQNSHSFQRITSNNNRIKDLELINIRVTNTTMKGEQSASQFATPTIGTPIQMAAKDTPLSENNPDKQAVICVL